MELNDILLLIAFVLYLIVLTAAIFAIVYLVRLLRRQLEKARS